MGRLVSKSTFALAITVSSFATQASAIYVWERGCTGVDGTNYRSHTDYDGVIAAHSGNFILANCEAGAIATIRGDSSSRAEKIYREMYFSDIGYDWSESRGRFENEGFSVQTDVMPVNFCLCSEQIIESSRWPEWPKPRQSEGE